MDWDWVEFIKLLVFGVVMTEFGRWSERWKINRQRGPHQFKCARCKKKGAKFEVSGNDNEFVKTVATNHMRYHDLEDNAKHGFDRL